MTDDLAAWLLEQIAEDERLAHDAEQGDCAGRWWAVQDRHLDDGRLRHVRTQAPFEDDPDPTYWIPGAYIVSGDPEVDDKAEANLRHIAAFDPARVLAECDAKRRIIRWVQTWPWRPEPPSSVDGLLELLALPYAGRPGYREEWRP